MRREEKRDEAMRTRLQEVVECGEALVDWQLAQFAQE
jgi:hypothetical protein